MVKEGNKRVIATVSANNYAKLVYIKDKLGLKDTGVINLAIDYYYDLLRRNK